MLSDLFSTEGRLGRVRYLLYSVSLSIFLAGGLFYLLGHPKDWIHNWVQIVRDPDRTHLLICVVFYLVVLRVSAAITVKRLHDVDLSGIFWFILLLVPLVVDGGAMSINSHPMMLLAAVLYLGLKAWLLFWPGTPGPNSFGLER